MWTTGKLISNKITSLHKKSNVDVLLNLWPNGGLDTAFHKMLYSCTTYYLNTGNKNGKGENWLNGSRAISYYSNETANTEPDYKLADEQIDILKLLLLKLLVTFTVFTIYGVWDFNILTNWLHLFQWELFNASMCIYFYFYYLVKSEACLNETVMFFSAV